MVQPMLEAAIHIIRTLRKAGHEALLAGGCVRDRLLGKQPKDYDVATSAPPAEVTALFAGSITVGAHFGVVIVRHGGHHIEVATFRTDGIYKDGRRPEAVTFSDARHDAERRDFTINGLFFDPVAEKVIDYVGGEADLRAGILRAIGDPERRFAEDHLRLLRAVRFAAALDFQIESSTWEAMRRRAADISHVSAERVRDELTRILLDRHRVRGFDLLVESGLMQVILPEIMALRGVEQPPQWHPEGDVFVHTRLMLSLLPDDASLPLVLSVLFHDIGKPATQTIDESGRIRFNGHDKRGAVMTEDILRRLRLPNHVINATVEAVENHMVFKDVQKMRNSTLKRFMARPTFADELELHRADCLGSNGYLDNYEFLQAKAEEFAREPLIPPRLVTGGDLIELGWAPGKHLGVALATLQNLQLEGAIKTKEEALNWLQTNFAPPPPSS